MYNITHSFNHELIPSIINIQSASQLIKWLAGQLLDSKSVGQWVGQLVRILASPDSQ